MTHRCQIVEIRPNDTNIVYIMEAQGAYVTAFAEKKDPFEALHAKKQASVVRERISAELQRADKFPEAWLKIFTDRVVVNHGQLNILQKHIDDPFRPGDVFSCPYEEIRRGSDRPALAPAHQANPPSQVANGPGAKNSYRTLTEYSEGLGSGKTKHRRHGSPSGDNTGLLNLSNESHQYRPISLHRPGHIPTTNGGIVLHSLDRDWSMNAENAILNGSLPHSQRISPMSTNAPHRSQKPSPRTLDPALFQSPKTNQLGFRHERLPTIPPSPNPTDPPQDTASLLQETKDSNHKVLDRIDSGESMALAPYEPATEQRSDDEADTPGVIQTPQGHQVGSVCVPKMAQDLNLSPIREKTMESLALSPGDPSAVSAFVHAEVPQLVNATSAASTATASSKPDGQVVVAYGTGVVSQEARESGPPTSESADLGQGQTPPAQTAPSAQPSQRDPGQVSPDGTGSSVKGETPHGEGQELQSPPRMTKTRTGELSLDAYRQTQDGSTATLVSPETSGQVGRFESGQGLLNVAQLSDGALPLQSMPKMAMLDTEEDSS